MTLRGNAGGMRPQSVLRRGFTLIELLVVIAIITLLLGILIPSLGRARDQAKRVKTQAMFKSIENCLEMFNGENPRDLRGNYPASASGDDPTEPTDALQIFGAQWLVRYLMGKDLNGYVPPSMVPKDYYGGTGEQQLGWYVPLGPGNPNSKLQNLDPNLALARSGPYLTPDAVRVKAPRELPGFPPMDGDDPNSPRFSNLILVDVYDMPILYYASNPAESNKPNCNPATWAPPPDGFTGVFSFSDNALFTGGRACGAGACELRQKWDFGSGKGPLDWYLGDTAPTSWKDVITTNQNSFAYYILNRGVFDSSNHNTVVPVRKDSFLLISPGKDGQFGTRDDIKNFD